jgi:hypothetical protein
MMRCYLQGIDDVTPGANDVYSVYECCDTQSAIIVLLGIGVLFYLNI